MKRELQLALIKHSEEKYMTDKAQTASIGKLKEQIRYAEWARQHEEQQSSGLSVTEWCKEKGISPSTYYNRLRRMREVLCEKYITPCETAADTSPTEQQSIVALRSRTVNAEEITIEYGGVKICIKGDIPTEKLSAIIGVLRSC